MDQSCFLVPKTFVTLLLAFCVAHLSTPASAGIAAGAVTGAVKDTSHWTLKLRKSLDQLEAAHPGQLGIYVKDPESGQSLSLRGEEAWYIASGVKLPVAITLLQKFENDPISLDRTKLQLSREDYLDGGGATNLQPPGRLLSIRYLLEQMLIYSDNTASDLLIRHIGLNAVNNFVQEFAPDGFSGITRLADVRRDMYSFFHPRAAQLGNPDFLDLWNIRPERARLRHLAKLLRLKSSELKIRHLDEAFTLYYAQKLNTAKLSTYGVLLEKLVESKLFARESTTRLLLEILARTATGRQRLRAGFPGHYIFAHKTGTQFKRACDFGISWSGQDLSPKPRRLVIAACVRDFKTTREAETALKKIGQAIYSSGALPR